MISKLHQWVKIIITIIRDESSYTIIFKLLKTRNVTLFKIKMLKRFFYDIYWVLWVFVFSYIIRCFALLRICFNIVISKFLPTMKEKIPIITHDKSIWSIRVGLLNAKKKKTYFVRGSKERYLYICRTLKAFQFSYHITYFNSSGSSQHCNL